MYRRYKRYYKYNRRPDIFDMAAEGIIGMGTALGWLIFKIFRKIFHRQSKTISLSESLYIPAQKTEAVAGEQKIYSLRDSLLTQAEKDFLKVLEVVVENRYYIELQVQLSRMVSPIDAGDHFVNYHDFNRIKAKSIDFVLYDNDYKPYLAIELDDSSHLRQDRVARDNFVDEVMKSVGLRIIHIPVSHSYDVDQLTKQIY